MQRNNPIFVTEKSSGFDKAPHSLDEKLNATLKAKELISYIVASHLPYKRDSQVLLFDHDSYGDIHEREVVIDVYGSTVLQSLSIFLTNLYSRYNNDLKFVQPLLSFRKVKEDEWETGSSFELSEREHDREIEYRSLDLGKHIDRTSLKKTHTVSIFAAASLEDPLSQTVGEALGETNQNVVIGGPGAIPNNIMIHTAKVAKKLGSTMGFVTTEFLLKKQGSIKAKPDFVFVTKTMQDREHLMFDLSHVVLALPGGIAVVEEVLTAIYWNLKAEKEVQAKKPILLWNTGGYWNDMYVWLTQMELQKEVILVDTKEALKKYLLS